VASTDLIVLLERPERVAFTVRSVLAGPGARPVEESYTVSASGVDVRSVLGGAEAPAATRIVFPALVSDGAADTRIEVARSGDPSAAVHAGGAALTWTLNAPTGASPLTLDGTRLATHDGYLQAYAAELPAGTREVRWSVRLQTEKTGETPGK
jgi:hypothetical protein